MKKSILGLAVLSAFSMVVHAASDNQMIIRVPMKTQMSNWLDSDPIYHPWVNEGSHYNCAAWSPLPSTINFGQNFIQTRDCDQNQQRDVEIRELDSFSNIVKTVRVEQEDRTITETESQDAVGEYRNWVSHASTFTEWTDFGSDYDHTTWSPVAAAQTADFTQSRDYKHDQERFEQKREFDTVTEDIRNIGELVRHTQVTSRNESRPVDVNATLWSHVGTHYNCAAWAPTPEEVDVYQVFTQTRDCSQNQIRSWTYATGGSEIHARDESQTIIEVESQPSVGTRRNWVSHDSTFTAWADQGATHSYTAWSPTPTSQTSTFTQTRNYKQPQERFEQKREIDTISGEIRNIGGQIRHNKDDTRSENRSVTVSWSGWLDSGSPYSCGTWSPATSTVTWGQAFTQTRSCTQGQVRNRSYSSGESYQESQGVGVMQSQGATGTSDYIASYTYGTWSGWSNSGGVYSCGSWSPSTSTVSWGQTFTQSRSCSQDQTRSRSVTAVWASGATSSAGSESSSQTVGATDTRSATGSSDYISYYSYGTWSGWSNSGGMYSCGSWGPSTSTVSWGQTFTQSRSCYQDQIRSRSVTAVWASGATSSAGIETGTRTAGATDTRSATGTSDYISYYTYSTWSGWSNSGGAYGCSAWSPDVSTVCSGTGFTQTRSCSQDQTRSRSVTAVWASGATSSAGNESGSQTISAGQSQGATGTQSCWVPASSTFTSWSTYTSGYGTWAPGATSQSSNFTQTRSVTLYQEQYEQKREYNAGTGQYRDVGTAIRTTRTVAGSDESRTVTVSNSGWVNSGSPYNCGGYSPATNTVSLGTSFTQTGSCSQNQVATYTYSIGGSYQYASQTVTVSSTQSAIGTRPQVVECKYSTTSPVSAWSESQSTGATSMSYNGSSVSNNSTYSYSRGSYRTSMGGGCQSGCGGGYNIYEICRTTL